MCHGDDCALHLTSCQASVALGWRTKASVEQMCANIYWASRGARLVVCCDTFVNYIALTVDFLIALWRGVTKMRQCLIMYMLMYNFGWDLCCVNRRSQNQLQLLRRIF